MPIISPAWCHLRRVVEFDAEHYVRKRKYELEFVPMMHRAGLQVRTNLPPHYIVANGIPNVSCNRLKARSISMNSISSNIGKYIFKDNVSDLTVTTVQEFKSYIGKFRSFEEKMYHA